MRTRKERTERGRVCGIKDGRRGGGEEEEGRTTGHTGATPHPTITSAHNRSPLPNSETYISDCVMHVVSLAGTLTMNAVWVIVVHPPLTR